MKKYVRLFALGALCVAFSNCSSAPQPEPDAHLKTYTVARRAPDLRLVGAITAHDHDRNMVISPYGLRRLFSILVVGARGRTHDQIIDALGVTDETDASAPPLVGFRVRDGMWIDRSFATLPSYEAAIRARFGAEIDHVDFGSLGAVPAIERWVSISTGGRIPRVPLGGDLKFVAIDALTYRVKWAQPFDVGHTKFGAFHAGSGTTSVPMMHREITAQAFGDAQVRYVRLPFTDGNSMLIALPTKGLTASTLTNAIQALDTQGTPMIVELALPRFTVSSYVDLVGPLEHIGMAGSFGRDADYSPIFGKPGIGLSFAFQQGAITVDEQGAQMSVVSVVGSEQGPQPVLKFKVDRPFAFVVEDTKSRQVLVAGIVAHP